MYPVVLYIGAYGGSHVIATSSMHMDLIIRPLLFTMAGLQRLLLINRR